MEYIYLLIGFILIIIASDVLVDASSSIAIKCKLPKTLIALTIAAFGTCAPELAISFTSVMQGNGDVALANVMGSCIINVVLIIGLAALLKPMKITTTAIYKELPILLATTTAFSILLLISFFRANQIFPRWSGIILFLLFGMFVYYVYQLFKGKRKKEKNDKPKYGLKTSIILVILTIIIIVYSSNIIVNNAIVIASMLGISEKIITMIAIVIGTSLPELVMTVTSAKKGEFEFALGNIIGTNIFNICIVLGLPIALFGGITVTNFGYIDIVAVMVAILMLYNFAKSDSKLTRIEGMIMLSIFIMYYTYILFF